MDDFRFPIEHGDKRNLTETLRFIAHLLFFGAYFVLNNPFIKVAATPKFLLFGAMVAAGAIIALRTGHNRLGGKALLAVAFFLFYGIAVLRLNEVQFDKLGDNIFQSYQQAILSLFTFVASIAFTKGIDPRMTVKALFIMSVPCGIWIILNFPALTDYELRATIELGNLTYDSYQTISTILAVAALCSLNLYFTSRSQSLASYIYAAVFASFGYFIFQGLARGEAIGFAIATALFLAPRLSLFAVPFLYGIFSFLVAAVETPLTARLRVLLEGDYGARDLLFGWAYDMLFEEPSLVFMGGGLNYFQKFWSQTSGTYPHNIFLEALISGGSGLLIVLLVCFVYPVVDAYRRALLGQLTRNEAFQFSLTVLLLIIALKSGSILAFWGVGTYVCVFLDLSRKKPVPKYYRQSVPPVPTNSLQPNLAPRFRFQRATALQGSFHFRTVSR